MGLLTELSRRKAPEGWTESIEPPAASELPLQNLDTWHPRDPEAVADRIVAIEEITANERGGGKKVPKIGTCPDFQKRWKDNL